MIDYSNRDAVLTFATQGLTEPLKLLLDAAPDADFAHSDGTPGFFFAIRERHADCLKLFIDHGCDLHARDTWGRCGAVFAALYDADACLALLIQAGANPETKDSNGRSLAALAIELGSPRSLSLLASIGVDIAKTAKTIKPRDWHPLCDDIINSAIEKTALLDSTPAAAVSGTATRLRA